MTHGFVDFSVRAGLSRKIFIGNRTSHVLVETESAVSCEIVQFTTIAPHSSGMTIAVEPETR